jgi:hypothetical protein
VTEKAGASEPRWEISAIRSESNLGAYQFYVSLTAGESSLRDVQADAAQLLDYAAFQAAVLQHTGRLIRIGPVEEAADPAAAWLDLVRQQLPKDPPKPAAGSEDPSLEDPGWLLRSPRDEEFKRLVWGVPRTEELPGP